MATHRTATLEVADEHVRITSCTASFTGAALIGSTLPLPSTTGAAAPLQLQPPADTDLRK